MLTVYSKPACSQCDMTIRLLDMRKLTHEVKKLDVDYTIQDLIDLFSPGAMPRSFPMIFQDGEYLGGLEDLKQAIVAGKVA